MPVGMTVFDPSFPDISETTLMRVPRLHIRTLLVAVAVVAVGLGVADLLPGHLPQNLHWAGALVVTILLGLEYLHLVWRETSHEA
jgi:hypothetical protein